MRKIHLTKTTLSNNQEVENDPVVVYDTTGLYTDPNANVNIQNGAPELRKKLDSKSQRC